MIQDVTDVAAFLRTEGVTLISAGMPSGAEKVSGVVFQHGHIVLKDHAAVPVVQNTTSIALFADVRPARYADLLAAPPALTGHLARTLFVQGTSNYYHFLVYTCPALLLLRAFNPDGPVLLTLARDFPASATALMSRLWPVFADGRAVEIRKIDDGAYSLSEVLVPIRPKTALSVYTSRAVILPFVLREAGIVDPLRERGPLKLFIRRAFAANGRNLSNQAEIEAWFVDRGYTAVNPGTMSMEEQILLFARATHIAGVEGAAFANILFAVHAAQILMISSPNTAGEKFFSMLAKNFSGAFHSVHGEVAPAAQGHRAADFTLSPARLEAFASIL